MFKDELRDKVWNEIRQHDVRAFAKQLTPEVFAEAARQADVRIGCSALNLVNLVWLGIAKAIQHGATFAFVLTTTVKLLEDQEHFYSTPLGKQKKKAQCGHPQGKKGKKRKPSKHHPYCVDPTKLTEEAFVQARQRMPLGFWMALLTLLAERFQHDHPQHLNFKGFRLLAMDGTTLTLPKADLLSKHYGIPKNGSRKQAAPQARMVMLTLPGVRIPIAYEVAPLSQSELELAGRLMQHVQANDLALIDRGFLTYGLFWQFQRRGAYFGTRLKKNFKYKKLKQLGQKDWLVEWTPKDSRGRWKDLPRSMPLRVIHYQFPGFRTSAIITNVLEPKRLSREDWVRLAKECDDNGKFTPGLYHRRWEIETSYFELKVVLKTKHLRSHTPASLEYELAGRVVYYLLLRWLIVQAAEEHGIDPLRISFTNAVRELELMRSNLVTSTATWTRNVLLPRLLARIASHLVPLRPGRHYPRPKDTKPKDRGHGLKQAASKISSRVNTKSRNNKRKQCRKA
jgi:Transposase DDE domain